MYLGLYVIFVEVDILIFRREGIQETPVTCYHSLEENKLIARGHGVKLTKERPRLDTRKFFFSQRAVSGWDRLPATVVNAETVNAFKNAYNRNYKNDMDNRSQ